MQTIKFADAALPTSVAFGVPLSFATKVIKAIRFAVKIMPKILR